MATPDESDPSAEYVVELPIDGVLDLHPFAPKEIPDLVATYLDECHLRGITSVRLIHGKGSGAQRAAVARVLARHRWVRAYRTADEAAGGWGATLVDLLPLDQA